MSAAQGLGGKESGPRGPAVAMRLEVITLAVSDPERSKRFYGGLGWRLDADIALANGVRIVQFTPPGSPSSIQFGTGLTTGRPGSIQQTYLVVADIDKARAELAAHGADVGEVFHRGGPEGRQSGPDPAHTSYDSFFTFNDPDGNGWLVQEVTVRLPGRVPASDATFTSTKELAAALRRAEAAHGQHEQRTGVRDANWADWYADYMVREQAGEELPL